MFYIYKTLNYATSFNNFRNTERWEEWKIRVNKKFPSTFDYHTNIAKQDNKEQKRKNDAALRALVSQNILADWLTQCANGKYDLEKYKIPHKKLQEYLMSTNTSTRSLANRCVRTLRKTVNYNFKKEKKINTKSELRNKRKLIMYIKSCTGNNKLSKTQKFKIHTIYGPTELDEIIQQQFKEIYSKKNKIG